MKFKLFQIHLEDLVNAPSNPTPCSKNIAWIAYTQASFVADVKLGLEKQLFKHVANIEAGDITGAFEVGSAGQEDSQLQCVEERVHSVGVGNILVDENNQGYVCHCYGWKPLQEELCALLPGH